MSTSRAARKGSTLNLGFREMLETTGCADGPNGVTYRIVPSDGGTDKWNYAVECTKAGERKLVVGWNSEPFRCIEAARNWARMDSTYVWCVDGRPYPERGRVE